MKQTIETIIENNSSGLFLLDPPTGFGKTTAVLEAISEFIKQNRKELEITQKEFAMRSGLGLRFIRELEQGKETLRSDEVNQALAMFGMEAVPGRMKRDG